MTRPGHVFGRSGISLAGAVVVIRPRGLDGRHARRRGGTRAGTIPRRGRRVSGSYYEQRVTWSQPHDAKDDAVVCTNLVSFDRVIP